MFYISVFLIVSTCRMDGLWISFEPRNAHSRSPCQATTYMVTHRCITKEIAHRDARAVNASIARRDFTWSNKKQPNF